MSILQKLFANDTWMKVCSILSRKVRVFRRFGVDRMFFRVFGTKISIRGGALVFGSAILRRSNISVCGSGNKIVMADGNWIKLTDCKINIQGNGNYINIGEGCELCSTDLDIIGDGCHINIKRNVTFNGKINNRNLLLCRDMPTEIAIGEDCMFSYGIEMRTSDSHVIKEKGGERINDPKSITLGNHVWVGTRSMILKGAVIGDGSVVAAGSILSGQVPENVIVAGIPARTIKTSIEWKR